MSYKEKVRRGKRGGTARWAIVAAFWTFLMALLFALVTHVLLESFHSIIFSFFVLFIIILTGIIFDLIGMAVAAADEKPFHAKAAKKIPGAKQAIYLVRNADRVSSFSNDLIGDISGVVSGVAGAMIILNFAVMTPGLNEFYLTVLLTAIIAALTVGGKAVGKSLAISRPTQLVFFIARFLNGIERMTLRKKSLRSRK